MSGHGTGRRPRRLERSCGSDARPGRPGPTALTGGRVAFGLIDAFGTLPVLHGRAFTGRYRPHLDASYVVGVVPEGLVSLRTSRGAGRAGPGRLLLLNPCDVHDEAGLADAPWSFRYAFPTANALREVAGWRSGAPDPWFPRAVVGDDALAVRLDHALAAVGERGATTTRALDRLADLLRTIVRRYARNGRPEQGPAGVRRARRFLTEEALPPVTLAEISREARLSAYHLVREFGRSIGLPPYAFYEQVRVGRSRDLLHQGVGLSRVAARTGFADQSHFTRHFAASAGVTPGKYLKMVKGDGRWFPLPPRKATAGGRN